MSDKWSTWIKCIQVMLSILVGYCVAKTISKYSQKRKKAIRGFIPRGLLIHTAHADDIVL